MANQINLDTNNSYTLQSIDELYTTYHDIKHVYHFQYKSEESACNFGDFSKSILDQSSHHSIFDAESCQATSSKTLVMKTKNKKIGDYVMAYSTIPKNYRFDIICSPLDGNTLIIYDNHIKN